MRMRRTIGLSLALLVASAPAMAKEAQPGHHHPVPSTKSKTRQEPKQRRQDVQAKRHRGERQARRALQRSRHAGQARRSTPPGCRRPTEYIGPLRVIGQREVGSAAWYGGRHIGRRTASGERLDAVHATAAHRSLPLHSLVRVTNLSNGRSVVAHDHRSRPGQPFPVDRCVAEGCGRARHDARRHRDGRHRAGRPGAQPAALTPPCWHGDRSRRNRRFHSLSPFCHCCRKGTSGAKSWLPARAQLTPNRRSIVFFGACPAHGLYRSGIRKVVGNNSLFRFACAPVAGWGMLGRCLPRARRWGRTPAVRAGFDWGRSV